MSGVCATCGNGFDFNKHRKTVYCSVRCHKHRLRDPKRAEAHFWARVNKDAANGCWLWTEGVDKWGYGDLRYFGKHIQAHRLAWRLLKGDPGEFDVLHKCNVEACCNIDHLYLGTDLQNAQDRVRAGTHLRGEQMYNAKLTDAKVREIRQQRDLTGLSYYKIAEQHRLSYTIVREACIGSTWAHVK